ncbi:hypothetical protein AB0G00_16495 [Nocardia salmonicida]
MTLPQRTPNTKRPNPTTTAPPTIIRRLLAALDQWDTTSKRAS